MAELPHTPKRKRPRRKNLESRYFPSPKRQKPAAQDSTSLHLQQTAQTYLLAQPCWTNKSRFFPPSKVDLDALLANPAFLCFYEAFVLALHELYMAKPILIQEHVASSSWKVLVAVTLLNKTAGTKSIPVFFEIMDRWPTPEALAQAPRTCLYGMIKDLGLGETRTTRIIDISQTFLTKPPIPDQLYRSRGTVTLPAADGAGTREVPYPPIAVSHIPGSGPYALDSYRIFCSGKDEWKSVRPRDKELVKYLEWKWAVEEYRQWHPLHGPGPIIDLEYVRSMTAALTSNPISH
ncbi:uncharacterized protein TRAVEDRAFT_153786 [Trametes versicolor FP-101664 SS1]|uniref:uncharacterized protein n=1 Tax=Trametes versicolor (strain FP-101664) TaxID=717944 RepID=UPI0004621E8A|nr:uncharacterized protein TRAVEDRAFT_153786 [Trametes versicolor FP-101664 SS1]EIW55408.1 hypothetical protein TRAVEDRAFT_153786 [Trametes versicolor FP-101664 SS1]